MAKLPTDLDGERLRDAVLAMFSVLTQSQQERVLDAMKITRTRKDKRATSVKATPQGGGPWALSDAIIDEKITALGPIVGINDRRRDLSVEELHQLAQWAYRLGRSKS